MSFLTRTGSGRWRALQAAANAVDALQTEFSIAAMSAQVQEGKDIKKDCRLSVFCSWHRLGSRRHSSCVSERGRVSPTYQTVFGAQTPVRWQSTGSSLEKTISSEQETTKSIVENLGRSGWSRQEVVNIPNGLSMFRMLSGPFIASWIVQGQWELALPMLAVSGATDWADGYVAKKYNQRSVLGSYLDPLADKTLMCSVIAALGYTGALSAPMMALVIGRDALLILGAFAARAKSLGWHWPGAGEFFRISQDVLPNEDIIHGRRTDAALKAGKLNSQQQEQQQQQHITGKLSGRMPAAPFVEPLYISKVNTCLQLGLAGACMLRAWVGVPSEDVVWWVASGTAVTTLWSSGAYLQAYMNGKLLNVGKSSV